MAPFLKEASSLVGKTTPLWRKELYPVSILEAPNPSLVPHDPLNAPQEWLSTERWGIRPDSTECGLEITNWPPIKLYNIAEFSRDKNGIHWGIVFKRSSCRDEKLSHKGLGHRGKFHDYFLSASPRNIYGPSSKTRKRVFNTKQRVLQHRQESTNHFLHVEKQRKYAFQNPSKYEVYY